MLSELHRRVQRDEGIRPGHETWSNFVEDCQDADERQMGINPTVMDTCDFNWCDLIHLDQFWFFRSLLLCILTFDILRGPTWISLPIQSTNQKTHQQHGYRSLSSVLPPIHIYWCCISFILMEDNKPVWIWIWIWKNTSITPVKKLSSLTMLIQF